ncbi:MAG: hypothetical protein R3F20_00095 [Planctomycetota bacterium]
MPSSSPRRALALLLLGLLGLTTPLSAQRDKGPEFTVGDLADLEVRVVRKPSGAEASLLVVEVTNRGKVSAEPLTFEMEITGDPDPSGRFMRSRYHRAGQRTWGRAGRSIRPGKTERYWLPPLWGPNTPLERTSVTISRASFFQGKGIDKCPVELVKLEDVKEFDDFQKIEVKRSRATFRNPTEYPVHIHYLCYPRTGEGVWLCHSRVDPKSDRVAGVDSPDPNDWDHLETTQRLFGRFERIEIVDWSVLVDAGHGSARHEFEAAWRSRFRWDFAMASALEGRIDWEWKDPTGGGVRKGKAKFRFEGRDTTFETDPPVDAESRRRLLEASADSLRVARSPSFEELVASCEIELVDRPAENSVVIELQPPARLQGPIDTTVMTITDGRIVSGATAGFSLRRTTHWTNVELPDGRYAPVGREVIFDNVPAWIRLELKDEVEWAEQPDLRFPAVVRRHETDAMSGHPNGDFVFRFSELAPSGPGTRAPCEATASPGSGRPGTSPGVTARALATSREP